jgi:uncharacterized membrane protein
VTDPFSPIRAATIHPALVHFTLGVVPVVVIAYGVALARRSERWSFAGDVALWIGAAFALPTVASGLVANALVPWPAGIAFWRWSHVAAGAASAIALLGFAAVRLRAFRRGAIAGRGALLTSLLVAATLGVTGWIGGEVLVFHSGIAVAAAAQGALAPTLSRGRGPPKDLGDAMARIRGAWAEARTAHDLMLVERPTPDGYARIAAAARDLSAAAEWLESAGPKHAGERGGPEVAATVEHMAGIFRARTGDLERAASAARWADVTRALAAVTNVCAGCHQATRWMEDRGGEGEHRGR